MGINIESDSEDVEGLVFDLPAGATAGRKFGDIVTKLLR